jgi:hypothetical protein
MSKEWEGKEPCILKICLLMIEIMEDGPLTEAFRQSQTEEHVIMAGYFLILFQGKLPS